MGDVCLATGTVAAEEGLPKSVPGYRKAGDSWVRTCPACEGLGRVTKPGDAAARKDVFEVTGLLGKGKGVGVNFNLNFGNGGMESAVERMAKVSFDPDAEDGDVIDAEFSGEEG